MARPIKFKPNYLAGLQRNGIDIGPARIFQIVSGEYEEILDVAIFYGTPDPAVTTINGLGRALSEADIHDDLGAIPDIVEANTVTDNYTLDITDQSKIIEMNSASNKTITIPPNADEAFPIGTVIDVYRMGTGTVTIAQGAGVTIRPANSQTLRAQYSEARLRKRATNEWVVSGDLT